MPESATARALRAAVLGLHRAARRIPRLSVVLFLLAVAVRLALLPWIGAPYPETHDEFSYLLGADTLARGRLSNPAHPHWEFFESIHVLSAPSCASKYQPGQAMVLALGQKVFGHPHWGAVLSVALLVASIHWMLKGWVRPGYALLGGIFSLAIYVPGHYWTHSYWGGAPAAAASACLLGIAGRVRKRQSLEGAWLLGPSILLLFWTRPYEGGALVLALGAGLASSLVRSRGTFRKTLLLRLMVPALVIVSAGLAWQAYYNFRVTGNPWRLPYLEHERRYNRAPVLWVMKEFPAKEYLSEELRLQHDVWERDFYRIAHDGPLARVIPARLFTIVARVSAELGPAILFLPALWFFRRHIEGLGLVAAATSSVSVALVLEVWDFVHYMGPLLMPVLVLMFLGAGLWVQGQRRPSWKWRLLPTLLLVSLAGYAAGAAVTTARQRAAMTPDNTRHGGRLALVTDRLLKEPGRHVVFVRYGASHRAEEGWIHNGADIDGARVIWARDRGAGENRRLLGYYSGRTFWLLEADERPPRLIPYDGGRDQGK